MVQFVKDEQMQEQVENLWQQLEEVFSDSNPLMAKLRSGPMPSELDLIIKETLRRIREEIGFDGSLLFFSNPSVFMERFMALLIKHSGAVKKEAAAGSLEVDGQKVKVAWADYNLEEDIKESEKAAAWMEECLKHEIAFQNALRDQKFDEAAEILRGMELARKDSSPLQRIEVRNWQMKLAIAKGDIRRFLELLDASMAPADELGIHLPFLRKSLQEIITMAMIAGLVIVTQDTLTLDERKTIDELFWRSLLDKIIEGPLLSPGTDVTEELFKGYVRQAAEGALKALSLYPKKIFAQVIWREF